MNINHLFFPVLEFTRFPIGRIKANASFFNMSRQIYLKQHNFREYIPLNLYFIGCICNIGILKDDFYFELKYSKFQKKIINLEDVNIVFENNAYAWIFNYQEGNIPIGLI